MKEHNHGLSTTVRLDERSSVLIAELVKRTGASQSDVIRHLVKKGLKEPSSIQAVVKTDLDNESKGLLFDISNNLSSILSAINRIGINVNKRRRKYNSERKQITDKIQNLQSRKRYMSMYEQAQTDEQIRELKDKVDQFDSKDDEFITSTEWDQFAELQSRFESIAINIGGNLNW